MAIRRTQVTVTCTGGAGTSAGNDDTSTPIYGIILDVHLNYSASMAATSDVVIQEANHSPAVPVLTVNNNATDGWYYPTTPVDDASDGSEVTGLRKEVNVADHLNVAVAQANNNDVLIATIRWEDGKS